MGQYKRTPIVSVANLSNLMHSSKMLILDEPTTSLTAPEREKLFVIMNKLKAQGISIIFISHYMDEIYKVSDKYIILRDGKQVDSGYVKDLPQRKMEELMVGRTIADSVLDIGTPSDVIWFPNYIGYSKHLLGCYSSVNYFCYPC